MFKYVFNDFQNMGLYREIGLDKGMYSQEFMGVPISATSGLYLMNVIVNPLNAHKSSM